MLFNSFRAKHGRACSPNAPLNCCAADSANRLCRIIILVLLLALPHAQGAVKTYAIRMPVSAVIMEKDDSGKTWRRNGVMPVTYRSAVNQIKACLGGQGWKLQQTIPLGNGNDRTLMNFQNGKLKITVMVWRIKLTQAGFSWGIVE